MTTPHIENFRVRFNEADASGFATVQTLGNWLQEAADQHARALGWAREQLQARQLFWALTGLRLVLADGENSDDGGQGDPEDGAKDFKRRVVVT